MESEADVEAPPAAKPAGKKRGLLFALIGLVVVLAGGGAAWFFLAGGPTEAELAASEQAEGVLSGPPIYLELEPAMIVNFQNPRHARYLQISVNVQARDAETIDAVKAHMPAIRNNLMLLFSSQQYEDLVKREGKEAVRQGALQEIQAILNKQIGRPGVEDVYFTNFVMQ